MTKLLVHLKETNFNCYIDIKLTSVHIQQFVFYSVRDIVVSRNVA